LPDLSRPRKSWLVRRVWENAPTANESRSDGLLQKKPWTSCRGPTSKISNNCVFGNGYLRKDISEGLGGYEQYAFQGVEVANNIVRGNRGPGIRAKTGDRQRTSGVSIHHNSLRNDTLKGCKLAGVVCWANRK
jgi:hypothetical protein